MTKNMEIAGIKAASINRQTDLIAKNEGLKARIKELESAIAGQAKPQKPMSEDMRELIGCARIVQRDWEEWTAKNNGDERGEKALKHVSDLIDRCEAHLRILNNASQILTSSR